MKLCPTCGEVYPKGTTECRADNTPLRSWAEATQTNSVVTSVTSLENTAVEATDVEIRAISTGVMSLPRGKHKTGSSPTFRTVDYDASRDDTIERILAERYLLGRQIGIGGYGAVFSATDQRSEEQLAVKLLSPALADDTEAITRFRREAIAASRIDHPGIIRIHDFHIEPSATSYIVMEYLDGEDLSEIIDTENKLEPARALAIAAQCADALAAAHDQHILHRDLKPANIFVTSGERRRDVVKIIDFGISKITRGEGRFTGLTSASKVVGTPYYMSPEQAQGFKLDGRTDVYSLGVILFRMLTGRRPFIGDSALDVMTKHISAPRIAPSEVDPALDRYPKLDRLVLTAMSAKTRTRFATMREFRTAILECLKTIDAGAATRLDRTQMVSRPLPVATALDSDTTPMLLEPSSGQVTKPIPSSPNRVMRWGSLAVAAAAAAAITWWVARPGPKQPEPPPAAATTPAIVDEPSPAPLQPDIGDKPRPTIEPLADTRSKDNAKPITAAATRANKPAPAAAKPTIAAKAAAKRRTPAKPKARVVKRATKRPKRRTKPRRNTRTRKNANIGIKDW